MNTSQIAGIILIVILSLISGWVDAQGFVHSSRIWVEGRPIWAEALKAGLAFGFGIMIYWLVIRFLNQAGVQSPEMQSILWFSVTIIGVALISREFFKWQRVDQIVAVFVLGGIGWLLFRTGG